MITLDISQVQKTEGEDAETEEEARPDAKTEAEGQDDATKRQTSGVITSEYSVLFRCSYHNIDLSLAVHITILTCDWSGAAGG